MSGMWTRGLLSGLSARMTCVSALRPAAAHVAVLWPQHQRVDGERGMAVGKRGVPKLRREVLKDKESRERRKEHARDAKARKATDMDRHVMQAYKELEAEEAQLKGS